MAQRQVHGVGPADEEEDESAGQIQSQVASIDAILDEIDTVLERDAETFVRGFVQKGGQ